jgi:hypothetical protein
MAKKKIDSVWESHYRPHLNPGNYRVSSAVDRGWYIETMMQRILLELAMNRFKWENLPDDVSQRWIEYQLAQNALAVFYRDEKFKKHFALAGTGQGNINLIGDPTQFLVYGNNFYSKTLDAADCVPIWANYTRSPDMDIILVYAHRLAQMDQTIEINSLNARKTKFIAAQETGRLSAVNVNKMIEDGATAIPVTDPAYLEATIGVLDLGINPDTIVNMHILRSREWNEVMGLLGINNANQDKKERLVADEVSANDDQIASIRAVQLNSREMAVDKINKKYGLKIKVSYQTDLASKTTQEAVEQ